MRERGGESADRQALPHSERGRRGGCARLTVVERAAPLVKAIVWFWIIDETLVLTSMLSMCRLNEVGTCQVMKQEMIIVTMVMTSR